MASYEVWHWRVFNLGVRLFGLGALLVAVVLIGDAIRQVVGPIQSVTGEGAPTIGDVTVELLIGALLLALGFLICRTKAYRPDLGDTTVFRKVADPFGIDTPVPFSGRRSWWTGEPTKAPKPDAV